MTDTPYNVDGAELIRRERNRQIELEGRLPEYDDRETRGEIRQAALYYLDDTGHHDWPQTWMLKMAKRDTHSNVRRLIIAGALIAAELDRQIRAANAIVAEVAAATPIETREPATATPSAAEQIEPPAAAAIHSQRRRRE